MSNGTLFTLATPQLVHQHSPQSTAFTRNLTTESNLQIPSPKSHKNKTPSLAGVLPSLSLPSSRSLSFYRSAPIHSPATIFYRLIKGNFFYPYTPKLNFKAFISIGSPSLLTKFLSDYTYALPDLL
jgi:hypothetical protein